MLPGRGRVGQHIDRCISAGVVRDKVNVEMIPEDFNYLTV